MFDTVETVSYSLDILAGILSSLTVNEENMLQATESDFSNATELADYLAQKGILFRQAHEIVGRLVLEGSKSGQLLQDIPLKDYQSISPVIEADVYSLLKSQSAVERRDSLGPTGFKQVAWQIKMAKKELI